MGRGAWRAIIHGVTKSVNIIADLSVNKDSNIFHHSKIRVALFEVLGFVFLFIFRG